MIEQDDITTMTKNNEFPLLRFVPEIHPKPWIILNNIIAISGCLLIAEYWYAKDHDTPTERPFATGYYLVWEFGICLFWVIESGLSASYQHVKLEQSLKWYTKLELVIAVYFTITTAWMLVQWNLTEYNANEIWWIALDVSFYVYLAIRTYLYRDNNSEGDQDNESTPDDEDGTYQRMELPNADAPSGALV